MGVMLQRDINSQRLYLHDVILEEEMPNNHELTWSLTGAQENEGHLFLTNILQNALNVKRNIQNEAKNARTDSSADLEQKTKSAETSPQSPDGDSSPRRRELSARSDAARQKGVSYAALAMDDLRRAKPSERAPMRRLETGWRTPSGTCLRRSAAPTPTGPSCVQRKGCICRSRSSSAPSSTTGSTIWSITCRSFTAPPKARSKARA